MRKLYGQKPNALDIRNTNDEINELVLKEQFLEPQLQSAVHFQIVSARRQLNEINNELKDSYSLTLIDNKLLSTKVSRLWLKLKATLSKISSYYE